MDMEKLIGLVQENTALWNTREKMYHNRGMQKKLWSAVAREMGFEGKLNIF